MSSLHVYTDGACSGNPGPGGWGVFITETLDDLQNPSQDSSKELFAGENHTTNNRMEMTAAIKALEHLEAFQGKIHIYTDSSYVKDGITLWVKNWQKNNWKTSAKKDVKNKDLWQKLLDLLEEKDVEWHWVKGHAGHPGNEKADVLARNGVMQVIMKEKIKERLSGT